jgi:tRNAThr (cytosine32-N3)-methyltransferase
MDNERPVREDLFGQRYLKNEDDVWNFNAWDNVEFTKERLEEINEILERQRDSAIDDERKKQLITNADRSWDSFYGRNANRFFKDRKWMVREFPEVFRESDSKVVDLFDLLSFSSI